MKGQGVVVDTEVGALVSACLRDMGLCPERACGIRLSIKVNSVAILSVDYKLSGDDAQRLGSALRSIGAKNELSVSSDPE